MLCAPRQPGGRRDAPVKTVRAENALLFRNDLVRARITHGESKAVYVIGHTSQPPAPMQIRTPDKARGNDNGGARAPQVSQNAVVPADAHGLVKIVVGDADVIAPDALGDVQMSCVCRGQVRFCVLAPKEVDGVDGAVLLRQVREVPFKRRLRSLGARNLDPLAERLQPLLLPKH